jgi:hypothetical protein
MLFSNYFVMYYIPCNYILIKSAGGRSAAALLRRDNVELSRVMLGAARLQAVERYEWPAPLRPTNRDPIEQALS